MGNTDQMTAPPYLETVTGLTKIWFRQLSVMTVTVAEYFVTPPIC